MFIEYLPLRKSIECDGFGEITLKIPAKTPKNHALYHSNVMSDNSWNVLLIVSDKTLAPQQLFIVKVQPQPFDVPSIQNVVPDIFVAIDAFNPVIGRWNVVVILVCDAESRPEHVI